MPIEFVPGPSIITGLAAISRYLQVSPSTAYRWITHHGLPAMRFPGRSYRTSTALIDLWILTWHKGSSGAPNATRCREVDPGDTVSL